MPSFILRNALPDFGGVEGVVVKLRDVFRFEELHVQIPLWQVSGANVGVKVLRRVIEVGGRRLLSAQRFHALLAFPVKFGEHHLALGIDELEGVHTEAVHLAVARWCPKIGIEVGKHVRRLRNVREEVEEPVGVLDVAHRRRLQRMDHVGEFDRVADEENREVVADEIPIALISVELCGEAAGIAQRLGGTLGVDHR